MVPRKKIVPISENAAYRVFLRKGKHIRYRTKALGDKEVDELLLMDKLPDNIDNKVDK